jgi:hypothetical protein
MNRLSTALAATALLALAGCGSRTANNTAAVDTSNDVYNVSPDDLTANVSDLGNGSNASTGNMSSGGNASSGSGNMSSGNSHASAGGNSSGSAHNSASHAARNSH